MALPAGTRLGAYEILAAIGAGGMGEVYEARDTKLGRNVAIKVLPANFVNDPERLARFQREARMLAALNHPNIATIYGLEHSDNTHFLIMELVPGETLAERVKAGPVPVEEALKIAAQIAEALEAAHEKNIIHRDLKPANVKVTPEGKVKVLDFGLAKAFEGDGASDDPSNSPTLSMAATMRGVILGTAAYMSPEQARGKAADRRTDIWAFGCVLYELLTGKQAFRGETATDIIAKILTGEPDWKALPSGTPAQIRQLLRRCLQKDKTLRMQAAGDARIEIQEALGAPVAAEPSKVAGRFDGRRLKATLGLTALVAAAAAGFAVWNLKPSSPPQPAPVIRSVFSLPPGDRLARTDLPAVAISPDGSKMVYVASRENKAQLYLRAMDSFEPEPIPGTENAVAPFFSPDGQWLGFFADAKLKKISINGGESTSLTDAAGNFIDNGGTWGSNNNILFQYLNSGGLSQVPAQGGTPKRLNTLAKGEIGSRWPVFLPGSKAVLFAASTLGWVSPQVVAYRLDTGERRNLVSGTRPYYSPTGHLLYVQGATLMAAPFDPIRMQLTGATIPVADGVLQSPSSGAAQYAVSENGSLVYIPGGTQGNQRTLVRVDRKGTEQPLGAPPHSYRTPRISPDGKRVAAILDDIGGHVWIYDLARDALTRLTFEAGGGTSLAWTRDGKRLTFSSGGPPNMFWQAADGSDKPERLTTSENQQNPASWSPDGRALAYMELDPATNWDCWFLKFGNPSTGSGQDRKPQAFLQSTFYESAPQFSPDGHWLAYVSNESGRFEIYVQPYPGPGGKWQISTEGGTEPAWNPNGHELFYRNGPTMMAVDVTTQPPFSAGKPRVLFEGSYLSVTQTMPSYDVFPDGNHFLMLKPNEQAKSPTQINIVQNWFEELKRRVPTGK